MSTAQQTLTISSWHLVKTLEVKNRMEYISITKYSWIAFHLDKQTQLVSKDSVRILHCTKSDDNVNFV